MESYIQQGDIIIFDNKHYLICGDSTLPTSYDYLKEKCAMTLTSPPYNVGENNCYEEGKNKKYLDKKKDIKESDDYTTFMSKVLDNALKNSKYVFWNIAHLSGNKISLIDFTYKYKYNFVDTMIWKKDTSLPAMESNVLNSDFEYIYIYTNEENNGKHIRIGQDFRGTISNVIENPRNYTNEYASIHSALMPLSLAENIISKFTNENDLVLDTFNGLGTTMMACIKLKRRYYGIEIEPYYCEKTIERYFDFITYKPNIEIIRDGKVIPYEEIRQKCQKKQISIFEL